MNASQLRACVWAFVFSLWERVRARNGGIDCLLLDDPQDQFDPINSENLAAAIAEMPDCGMRPLVTSNDYRFLDAVRDKLPVASTAGLSWYAGFVSPISNSRLTAESVRTVAKSRNLDGVGRQTRMTKTKHDDS